MLRIHFTTDDLVRTRVAPTPDPLWEAVLSLTQLQRHDGPALFDRWRRQARARLVAIGETRQVLLPLVPQTGYFPDFLTPVESMTGLDAGLEALLSTPRRQLDTELELLASHRNLPTWTRALPGRDWTTLARVARSMREFHDAVIQPEWPTIEKHIEADRRVRAEAMLSGGPEGLLRSLGPGMRWVPPMLEAEYPVDRDLHLDGRGLLLIPSYFNWGKPVTLYNPELQPILVYSTTHRFLDTHSHSPRGSDGPLVALLGRTRSLVLQSVGSGVTTGELARRVGTSAASASRHATVLRNAALVTTQRRGGAVLHTLTPLGVDLLSRAGLR